MSIIFKIYSDVADKGVTAGSTNYSDARGAVNTTSGAGTFSLPVGQQFATPNYSVMQVFLQFDLSSVPAGGTSYLDITCQVAAPVGGDTLEVHQATTAARKIQGGLIAGLTSLGSMATPTTTGHKQITMTADPTRSATSYLLLSSGRENANVAPTGNEHATYYVADQTGTVSDPFLQMVAGTAWDFIAAGTSVEATATSHILTEPAGVAAGDLLVACIGSRIASFASITLPAGWTRILDNNNNNVLATNNGFSSAMMAYIIRGASAPALTFTHPVAPSVALGRIVAYRNVNQTTPFDVATLAGTPAATLACAFTNVPALVTTADDDLIVAMVAGGQEAAYSAFNATNPGTSSGTTSASVLDPIWGQWLERAEQVTTTGADTSLAIYDAVKQTAGATGDFVATATVSASHSLIAGAFKLAPPAPTGTTYNETVAETLTAAETIALLTESLVRETEAADWRETESGAIRITEGDFFTAPAIEASVAESASAADTVTSALAYTKAIAETATAADTITPTLTRVGAIAESAAAADTSTGPLTSSNAIVETANAIETLTASLVSAPGVFDETVVETAAAVDTVSKTLTWTGALAENAGANETVDNTMLRIGALAESAAAADTSTGLLTRIGAIVETASAAETINASIIPAAAGTMVVETAPVVDSTAASAIFTRAIAESASAAETIGKTLSLTSAVAETAGAVETIGGLALRVGAIAESTSVGRLTEAGDWRETEAGVPRGTASTVETVGGVLTSTAAIVESASAAETITYSLTGAAGTTYNEAQLEAAAAAETVAGRLTALSAVAEAASAFETTTWAVSYTRATVETAAAADTVGGLAIRVGAVAETTAPVETIVATVVPAGGEVPWTPEEITSGMTVWYDAADASTLTFSGSNLTQWADRSPAANHAVPWGTGPSLVSTIGGLGALYFEYQGLRTSTAVSFGDFTIFVVFYARASGNYERLIDHSFVNGFWIGRQVETAVWGGGVRNTSDPYGYYVALANDTAHQISMQRSGASQFVSGDGGTVANSGTVTTAATTSNYLSIGSSFDNATATDMLNNDVIGEVVLWSRALSADEMARTEGYLAHKWGIAAKLPVDHPYKDAPPTVPGESVDGYIKVWNGTSWDLQPVNVWSGSGWVAKPVKVWDGSAWVLA